MSETSLGVISMRLIVSAAARETWRYCKDVFQGLAPQEGVKIHPDNENHIRATIITGNDEQIVGDTQNLFSGRHCHAFRDASRLINQ
jgi:hypothetical protein